MGAKSKTKTKAKTIDSYLAALSSEKRAALERLQKTIRAAVPGAEECISYGIPAFRLDRKTFHMVWRSGESLRLVRGRWARFRGRTR